MERYFAGPGQACSYKVGHTVWNKVREDAKKTLAPKFDLKAYHDAVLLSGGEAAKPDSRIVYPMNEERRRDMAWSNWWEAAPRREMGPHGGKPAKIAP